MSISHRALFLAAILARMVLPAQAPPIYVIRTIVGSGANPLQTAKDLDVISGSEATLVQLSGLIRDANGRLYSTERNVIRRYDPVTGPNGSRTCGIPNVQDLTGRINKDRL